MRRVGLVLAGLGACLIVFAVLMVTWVSSQVIKFPLNQYASIILTGGNASYFSAAKLTEMTDVNMEATYTIKGNAAAGSDSTAVWDQFVYVYDQSNRLPVQTMTRTMAFDRKTALLTNCCGANVNGDSSIQQRGYVGIVLPIGTQKQTYDVFDVNLNRPVPFHYAGTDNVNGTGAYRFVGTVAPIQNGTQTVPGSLVGMSQASVTLPQYYQTQVTYWIDPITGALLNVTQNEKLALRDPSGTRQVLLLFDANLAATPDSVDSLVAIDNSQLTRIGVVRTLLPLVTGIAGLILLIVGIVLFRRPRQDAGVGASTTDSGLAPAEAATAQSEGGTRPSLVPGLDDEPREATAESPVVKEEAKEEAQPSEPETPQGEAESPKAESPKAESPKAEAAAAGAAAAVAADAPAAEAPAAEAPAAEAPAAEAEGAKAEAENAETPAADAESQETKAEDMSAEAPTAEMPATGASGSPEATAAEATAAEATAAEATAAEADAAEADAADAPADAPATEPRRGRRGAHRR